ncbi:MAG: DNRLRE domain-containing protein [Methanobacteriota archaeon]
MKIKKIQILVVIIILSGLTSAQNQLKVTLQPSTNDAYTHSYFTDYNFGGRVYIRAATFYERHIYIQFELPPPPSCSKVDKANLSLWHYLSCCRSSGERQYGIYRITEPWGEKTITWLNAPATELLPTDIIPMDQTLGWKNWDVTADIAGIIDGAHPNYGWMIKDQEQIRAYNTRSFVNKRSAPGFFERKPKLEVEYILFECVCVDGIDNDGDGLTDCDDVECQTNPSCTGVSTSTTSSTTTLPQTTTSIIQTTTSTTTTTSTSTSTTIPAATTSTSTTIAVTTSTSTTSTTTSTTTTPATTTSTTSSTTTTLTTTTLPAQTTSLPVGIQETIVMQPSSKDSYTHSYFTGSNYGSQCYMRVSTYYEKQIYVGFGMPTLPECAVIDEATLSLWDYYSCCGRIGSRDYGIYRVTEDWVEETINWANQPGWENTPTDVNSVTPTAGWKRWDVSEDVKKIMAGETGNHGWMIRDLEDTRRSYSNFFFVKDSSNSFSEKKPKLEITYHLEDCD